MRMVFANTFDTKYLRTCLGIVALKSGSSATRFTSGRSACHSSAVMIANGRTEWRGGPGIQRRHSLFVVVGPLAMVTQPISCEANGEHAKETAVLRTIAFVSESSVIWLRQAVRRAEVS